MYEQIEQITTKTDKISSSYIELEVNKGRTEWRQVLVSDYLDGISKEWAELKQVIKVHRIIRKKGKSNEETAYYISNLQRNALFYIEGIRAHWAIENSLHWVKDVTFKEDDSKIRTQQAPQNISTLKNISINILRNNNYTNMASAQRLVSNNIPLLAKLIA